uniref:ARAD1D16654p n=1 Tax=Blastobotrys adeninivorans TaxID=409370 RepID=A0A060T992_BLAAD
MLRRLVQSPVITGGVGKRALSSSSVLRNELDAYEQQIFDKLQQRLSPKELMVKDVSGGCGSMFAIQIVSDQFKGMPMVRQHRLVNDILKDDISQWHGLQLKTRAE